MLVAIAFMQKLFQIIELPQDWLERGTKGFRTLGGSEGVTQECQSCIIQKLAMSKNVTQECLSYIIQKQSFKKVTQGVLLWSAPLTLPLNGQTVAVLLMDTQVPAIANTSVKQINE